MIVEVADPPGATEEGESAVADVEKSGTPWPAKLMFCGEITSLPFRETAPMTVDTVLGEKINEIGQTTPGWIAPQVSLALTVGAEDARLARFSAAFPQFVRCTVCVFDELTCTGPKLTPQESRQREGAGVTMFNLAMKGWLIKAVCAGRTVWKAPEVVGKSVVVVPPVTIKLS